MGGCFPLNGPWEKGKVSTGGPRGSRATVEPPSARKDILAHFMPEQRLRECRGTTRNSEGVWSPCGRACVEPASDPHGPLPPVVWVRVPREDAGSVRTSGALQPAFMMAAPWS